MTEADFDAIAVRLTHLFDASWSYDEFIKVLPFGQSTEGQAVAFSTAARIDGSVLSGSYRLVQYPRWRSDGLYIPDAHGLLETRNGQQVITQAGGFVLPEPEADQWSITHWLRLWTSAVDLEWLNATLAIGAGSMINGEAHVRYWAVAPASELVSSSAGTPELTRLGTAVWNYPLYVAMRMAEEREGRGFAESVGHVTGGPLHGTWRGWHYPTYLHSGLYQLDAHGTIDGPGGRILNRHAGLATRPVDPASGVVYEVVQHATFVTEIPTLAALNRTLVVGVGYVRDPAQVRVSWYAIGGRS